MNALLYIRLLAEEQTIAYGNPVLDEVKKLFPDVAALDVDSQSGDLVLHYAMQLLREAEQVIVCIDSAEGADFRSIFPLIEMLLDNGREQLILFRSSHTRLQRMVQARPELQMKLVQDDAELVQEIAEFYS